jgi:hypothetical protein
MVLDRRPFFLRDNRLLQSRISAVAKAATSARADALITEALDLVRSFRG